VVVLCEKSFAAYGSRILLRLYKKYFYGASRQIIFLETHHFQNFALRNFENDVSLKIILGLCKKVFYGASRRMIF
jgi:hypothetical protein